MWILFFTLSCFSYEIVELEDIENYEEMGEIITLDLPSICNLCQFEVEIEGDNN